MEPANSHMLSLISQIHWRPGVGDPTIVGWITVLSYFAVFLLSVLCAKSYGRRNPNEITHAQHRIWWVIAFVLLLLCINKQLDLQSLITDIGRVYARRQGWYDHRRMVQSWFIACVVFSGFFSLLLAWRALRNAWQENCLTITGLIFLVGFVVIRAASFHNMDRFLGGFFWGLKMNGALELGGIFTIGISAATKLKRSSNA